MTSDYLLRTAIRTLTVLAVVFISYGGIGVVAAIRSGEVHAASPAFDNVAFSHPFSSEGVLHEASSSGKSSSPYFWVLSGAKLIQQNGAGTTIQGELSAGDPYAQEYARYSETIFDGGVHPQNDFRLLTKTLWDDARQELTVTINDHNLSRVENRHPWNGVDLISRYQSDGSFYFATIRMDGKVTLKKYAGDQHYELGKATLFSGGYSKDSNPTLLPEGTSMRFALETFDSEDGSVTLRVLADKNNSGTWTELIEKVDTGVGGAALRDEGRSGFFSDYMDVSFDNYRILTLGGSAAPETERPSEEPLAVGQTLSGLYGLASSLTLEETGSAGSSPNSYWWVNSGAYFIVENGIGKTNEGELPSDNKWRELYAQSNPRDTDNGYHPQNIFRLVSKEMWEDVEQQAYFNIREYHESDSPLRTGHNGFLFFNRYKDGDNLYYTGLRVDGTAIVKKKINGTYYTLASGDVFDGSYSRTSNSNLIPEREWVGLKSQVTDNADGSVRIRVYADTQGNGDWELVADVTDDGRKFGPVISGKASVGIRTDYMDVWFKDYVVKEL